MWDSPSPGMKVLRNRHMTARGKGMVGIAARKVPFFSRTSTTTPPPAAGAPTTALVLIWQPVPSLSAMSVSVVLSPSHTQSDSLCLCLSPPLSTQQSRLCEINLRAGLLLYYSQLTEKALEVIRHIICIIQIHRDKSLNR